MSGPKFLSLALSGTLTAFPNHEAGMVHILNNTGADVTLARYGSESDVFVIKDGQAWSLSGITNTNQIKASGSGTLYAEAE